MNDAPATLPVPLVTDMIHRPDAPAHMMRIKKGDTTYFDLANGEADEIGWSYTSPLPFAGALAGHVAFDASRTTFESAPSAGV